MDMVAAVRTLCGRCDDVGFTEKILLRLFCEIIGSNDVILSKCAFNELMTSASLYFVRYVYTASVISISAWPKKLRRFDINPCYIEHRSIGVP